MGGRGEKGFMLASGGAGEHEACGKDLIFQGAMCRNTREVARHIPPASGAQGEGAPLLLF
ncbi:MAG TPA: hypothetical protein VGO91_03505 [Pyrinomonadaceae bacterium]|jgi:hypothetical protein|nr:hypothetical protein [Pyrinomonadaceae bacterium]